MSFLSITPANTDSQNRKNKKEANKDIVIKEVYFRSPDFKPLKAIVVMDGRQLITDEKVIVDIRQIKTIDILKDRKATRKYGRSAKNGAIEIRSGSVGELSAEGYDPLNFKIKGRVFTSDLTIMLDKKNEPDQKFIPIHRKIKDFSGNWKYTEKQGKFSFVYQIHQYDSDSINFKRTIIADGKEHTGNSSLVFNTVEKDKMVIEDNLKAEHLCSIDGFFGV